MSGPGGRPSATARSWRSGSQRRCCWRRRPLRSRPERAGRHQPHAVRGHGRGALSLDRLGRHLEPGRGTPVGRPPRRPGRRARARAAHDRRSGSAATGVYVSDDFGDTWTQARRDTGGVRVLLPVALAPVRPDGLRGHGRRACCARATPARASSRTALAGTAVHRVEWPGPALVVACDRGVLVSTDEGRSFAGPGAGLPAGPVRAIVLSSFFAADPVLFAAPASGGVYRSVGRRQELAGLRPRRARRSATSCGSGRSSTRRAPRASSAARTRARPGRGSPTSPGRPSRLLFPLAPGAGLEAFLATEQGPVPDARRGRALGGRGLRRARTC